MSKKLAVVAAIAIASLPMLYAQGRAPQNESIRQDDMRADLFFLGVTGVHPDAGLSTGDAEEAAVKRALHERAAETVVLASAEKLMAASPFLVAALAEISLLVVPTKTPDRIVRALRTGGVKVERARRPARAVNVR